MKLWVGKEKEGTNKGTQTLFIASNNITYNEIFEAVKKYKIKQLYFGAGLCGPINYKILKLCKKNIRCLITAEADYLNLKTIKKIPKNINLIVTFNLNLKCLNQIKNAQIKFQDLNEKHLYICKLSDCINTNLKNFKYKTYKNDIIIKE